MKKHFDEKYVNRNNIRPRLDKKLNPIPTIQSAKVYNELPSLQPSRSQSRKPPKSRTFSIDEIDKFKTDDIINDLDDVNESLLKCLDGYTFQKYEDHVIFFKSVVDDLSVPEIKKCICVNKELC